MCSSPTGRPHREWIPTEEPCMRSDPDPMYFSHARGELSLALEEGVGPASADAHT